MTLTKSEIAGLREVAKGAWELSDEVEYNESTSEILRHIGNWFVRNHEFIATFTPKLILRLLDEIEGKGDKEND